MSVYIKGMKKPENCEDCPFFTLQPLANCALLGYIISSPDEVRLSECPIVEVSTPHGRLIDADDIDNHIIGHVDTSGCKTIIEAEE